MRQLTSEEIATFAGRKGVRKIAVENFLGTMGENYRDASMNLKLDARLYRWSTATVKAIEAGIELANK